MKLYSALKNAALAAALALCGLTSAQAQWTSWTDAYAPYPNPVFTPDDILRTPGSGSEYMWYCTNSMNCLTGTESPYVAEFKLQVNLPIGGVDTAMFQVLADDYFSLYVNGQLADSCASVTNDPLNPCVGRTQHGASGWLTNTNPIPPTPFLVDMQPYLAPGDNEIFIFACNGDPSLNSGPPGTTPGTADVGCLMPSPNLYQYVLVSGSIVGFDNTQGGAFYTRYVSSGSANDGGLPWQARGLPEPSGLALAGLGLACIGGLRCRRQGGLRLAA